MAIENSSSVSILGMGSTLFAYLQDFERDYRRPTDDVWAINSAGVWLHDVDMIIALDNFRRDLTMDGGAHETYVQNILKRGVPVMSDVTDSQWPQVQAYPLRDVICSIWPEAKRNEDCFPWFQNTCNYALALAIARKYTHIRLYGCNFMAGDNPYTIAALAQEHEDKPYWWAYHMRPANKGRQLGEPGLETMCWLIGIAHQRGIEIHIPDGDSLMNKDRAMYWYGPNEQPDPFEEDAEVRGLCADAIRKIKKVIDG
jgi:hypothetical protein